jgi:hypothetical protein
VKQVGVITDIVRSRDLANRSEGQASIHRCFEEAHRIVRPVEPLWATAGDEFQSVYATVEQAVTVTMLVRTLLPDDVDCRFGLGRGEIRHIEGGGQGHTIEDGPAWWSARDAISSVHRMQDHGQRYLRTWFAGEAQDQPEFVNAFLASRDHLLSRMKARERRIAAAYLFGQTQSEIARAERMSQSAVSQGLRRSGATALALGLELFRVAAATQQN